MTITQIQFFIETANTLNFTVAAEHLFVTQPTLSRQIINIEAELNTKLFIRSKNSVRLTPAGEVLYKGFTQIYADYNHLIHDVNNISKGYSGELRIALSEEQILSTPLATIIRDFHSQYPHVDILISSCNMETIRKDLLNNQYDFANIVAPHNNFLKNLKIVPLSNEAMFFYIEKKLALSNTIELSSAEILSYLESYPLLLPNAANIPGNIINSPAKMLAEETGIDTIAKNYKYIPNISSLSSEISLGLGCSLVNETHILSLQSDVQKIKTNLPCSFEKVAAYNPQNTNPVFKTFLAMLEANQSL